MRKPTSEEIIELVMLLIATAVAVVVFTTTFIIGRAIIQSVF
jgi:hypothetical protein